jgi:hypothetical protein
VIKSSIAVLSRQLLKVEQLVALHAGELFSLFRCSLFSLKDNAGRLEDLAQATQAEGLMFHQDCSHDSG